MVPNRIGGVMVKVLASSALDRWFKPRAGQTKDNKIGIHYFFDKYRTLRCKSKDCLAQNQENMRLSTVGTCLPWTVVSVSDTVKIQPSMLGLVVSEY